MPKKQKKIKHSSVLTMKEFMKGAKKSTLFEDAHKEMLEESKNDCLQSNKTPSCPFYCPYQKQIEELMKFMEEQKKINSGNAVARVMHTKFG